MSVLRDIFSTAKSEGFLEGSTGDTADWEYFQILRDGLYEEVEKHKDKVAMAHNYQEIKENWKAGLSSAMLTVEDG